MIENTQKRKGRVKILIDIFEPSVNISMLHIWDPTTTTSFFFLQSALRLRYPLFPNHHLFFYCISIFLLHLHVFYCIPISCYRILLLFPCPKCSFFPLPSHSVPSLSLPLLYLLLLFTALVLLSLLYSTFPSLQHPQFFTVLLIFLTPNTSANSIRFVSFPPSWRI